MARCGSAARFSRVACNADLAASRSPAGRRPCMLGQHRSIRVYIVKAADHRGSTSFACGTPDQALDKAFELTDRGFTDVTIKDPKGKEWTAAALESSLG